MPPPGAAVVAQEVEVSEGLAGRCSVVERAELPWGCLGGRAVSELQSERL